MYDKDGVLVKIDDIKRKKALANEKYNELHEMILTFKRMVDDTKMVYDTNSSKKFRVIAIHYIDIVNMYLEKVFKPYIDKLDKIINLYNEFSCETNTVIGVGDNSEI